MVDRAGSIVRVPVVEDDPKVIDAEVIDAEVVETTIGDSNQTLRPPVDLWGAFLSGVAEGVRKGLRD